MSTTQLVSTASYCHKQKYTPKDQFHVNKYIKKFGALVVTPQLRLKIIIIRLLLNQLLSVVVEEKETKTLNSAVFNNLKWNKK